MQFILSRITAAGITIVIAAAVIVAQVPQQKSPVVATVTAAKAPQPKSAVACQEPNELSKDEIVQILNSHNAERSSTKIPDIVWDCRLADIAQKWASRGVAEHQDNDEIGENIFVATDPAYSVDQAMVHWLAEKQNFVPESHSCAPGKTCTHYTQVVARISVRVGCGINRNASGKWKLILVCDYDPAGNVDF